MKLFYCVDPRESFGGKPRDNLSHMYLRKQIRINTLLTQSVLLLRQEITIYSCLSHNILAGKQITVCHWLLIPYRMQSNLCSLNWCVLKFFLALEFFHRFIFTTKWDYWWNIWDYWWKTHKAYLCICHIKNDSFSSENWQ